MPWLATEAGVAFLTDVFVNIVVAAAISYVLAPDQPTADDEGITQAIKKTASPRNIIYGRALVGGTIIYQNTGGSPVDNPYLHYVIVTSTHPVEDIEGFWLNEEYIDISGENFANNDLDANYYISTANKAYGHGDFAGLVQVIKVTGWGYADLSYVPTGSSFTKISEDITRINAIPSMHGWNPVAGNDRFGNGSKLTNCSYLFLRFIYKPGVWSGFPQIRGILVKGKRLFDPTKCLDTSLGIYGSGTHDINDPTTWEWSENWALACLDYLMNSFYGLSADVAEEINWDSFIEATNDSGELVPNGYTTPDATDVPRYTVNGILYTDSSPISNFEALLASGAGTLIYGQGKYTLKAGVYKPAEDYTNIITQDNLAGPIQIRTATPRSEIFNKVAAVYTQAWDDNDPPKPVFESTDIPIINPLIATGGINPYEQQDGEEIIKELDFPFCIYSYEAQRLSRIALERIRNGLIYNLVCNLSVLKYSVGDCVYLGIFNDPEFSALEDNVYDLQDRLGLTDSVQGTSLLTPPAIPTGVSNYYKQFRIVRMEYGTDNKILLSLVEEAPEIYEWNEGDAFLVDYAPNADFGGLAPTETLLPPTWVLPTGYDNIALSSINTTTGNQITVNLFWAGAQADGAIGNGLDRAYATNYELQYGIVTNPSNPDSAARVTTWIPTELYVPVEHAATNNILQGPKPVLISSTEGIAYDFRVRALSPNRRSAWAYYEDELGSDFELATSGTGNFIPEAPEAILVERVDDYTMRVAVDVGTTFNTTIEDPKYVELIQCIYNTNPVDDYGIAYLTGQANWECMGYKQEISEITADNNWIIFENITSKINWVPRFNQRRAANSWFWARIGTHSGNISPWYPTTTGDHQGIGPYNPLINQSTGETTTQFDNFIDPETGEIINVIDGPGPGAGPIGTFASIVQGTGILSVLLRYIFTNDLLHENHSTGTAAGVFESSVGTSTQLN